METSFFNRSLDANEGQRTNRYSKGQTDDDSLNKQTELHAVPETVMNDGYQSLVEGGHCTCRTPSGPVPVPVMSFYQYYLLIVPRHQCSITARGFFSFGCQEWIPLTGSGKVIKKTILISRRENMRGAGFEPTNSCENRS